MPLRPPVSPCATPPPLPLLSAARQPSSANPWPTVSLRHSSDGAARISSAPVGSANGGDHGLDGTATFAAKEKNSASLQVGVPSTPAAGSAGAAELGDGGSLSHAASV